MDRAFEIHPQYCWTSIQILVLTHIPLCARSVGWKCTVSSNCFVSLQMFDMNEYHLASVLCIIPSTTHAHVLGQGCIEWGLRSIRNTTNSVSHASELGMNFDIKEKWFDRNYTWALMAATMFSAPSISSEVLWSWENGAAVEFANGLKVRLLDWLGKETCFESRDPCPLSALLSGLLLAVVSRDSLNGFGPEESFG